MLQVKGICKSFDGFMAVKNAELTVAEKEIVAVIGPNGAGKTTLFHMITGNLAPDAGEIRFMGEEIAGLPPYAVCRKGISRSYQVVNVFHRLTVFENVRIAVLSRRKKTYTLFYPAARMAVAETRQILAEVGLQEKSHVVSGMLSHGDRKVLEIAVALGNRPRLFIMDEPTAGMSPEETAAAIELIRRLSRQHGLTILLCEHDMNLVFALAQRIMVMQQGTTLIQADPDTVRSDERVRAAYLGGGS